MTAPTFPENLADYCAAHRGGRARGEDGHVKLVGKREKKWEGSYHVYVPQADGSEKRIRRTRIIGTKVDFPTKKTAEDEHRAWLRRLASRPVTDSARSTVANLCDDYFAMREKDWEERTQAVHRSLFSKLIKPAIGERTIESIRPEDLKALVDGLVSRTWTTAGTFERGPDKKLKRVPGKKRTGVSLSYAKKAITVLRAIFDYAAERDFIAKNPARSIRVRLRVPKDVRLPDKSVFPPQYLAPLLAQLTARDSLIVWISILGATRPAETFALRGSDVGPSWVLIERALGTNRKIKSTKTRKSRFVFLPPQLAGELHDWIAAKKVGHADLLFSNERGGAIDRANFLNRKLRPAAERAKVPVKDVDFQMLRRSFATLSQIVGLDLKAIQSQLGHSRPDMTASVYMQPIDGRTASQMEHLENIMRGRAPIPVDVAARIGTVSAVVQ